MENILHDLLSIPMMCIGLPVTWFQKQTLYLTSHGIYFVVLCAVLIFVSYVLMVILTYKELKSERKSFLVSFKNAVLASFRHWFRASLIPVTPTCSIKKQIIGISSKTLDEDSWEYVD